MRLRTLALTVSLCLAAALAFAAEFNSLQGDMTPEQFRAAGLNKLSAEELATLNAWLKGEMHEREVEVAAAPRPDRAGFRETPQDIVVESRIAGEFRGWNGKTKFPLENGQIWIQAEDDTLAGVRLQSPAVSIKNGLMGDWRLKVEGYNSTVKVKRIK